MGNRDQITSGGEMGSASAQPGGRSLAVTRAAAVVITVGIGAASFVLSFAALHNLAARASVPAQLAWLWPLIVDGTILQATMAVVALAGYREQDRSRRYFWIVLSSAAAVSLGANALHAVVPASAPLSPWLAAAIAIVAPVGLLATTHGLSLLIRVPRSTGALRRQETADVRLSRFDHPTVSPPAPETVELAEHSEPHTEPVGAAALQPWEPVAEVITSRQGTRDFEVSQVACVLHLSYERELGHQAIGRQLGIDQRVVDEIVSASAALLSSGDVSVERVGV